MTRDAILFVVASQIVDWKVHGVPMDLMDLPSDLFWGEFQLSETDREALEEYIARAESLSDELLLLLERIYQKWKRLDNPPEP